MEYVLILGAKSDLGQSLAIIYAKKGFNLYLTARNPFELKDFQNDLVVRYNVLVKTIRFDASTFKSHKKTYEKLNPKPKIAIYVIGYLSNQEKAENDFEEVKKLVNANYLGCISILNIIANDFEKRENGTIVGISSVAGDRGRKSNYLYGSTKAGFTSYLSGLRGRLYKSKVHVLTVKPGFMKTKMTENLRFPNILTSTTKDVANIIFEAERKKKDIIYIKNFWKYIMFTVRAIPEKIFKRISL